MSNQAFLDLLASKELNRKKKKKFPDYWIARKYKAAKALELSFKYFSNTITDEEKKLVNISSCWDARFYLIRGFSEPEAIECVRSVQSKNYANRAKKYKDTPILSPLQLEYYIAKGMTFDEAQLALKTRQSTFSLASNIKKYGEVLGLERWQKRQDKWQSTMRELPEEEIKRIKAIQQTPVAVWALQKSKGDKALALQLEKKALDGRRTGTREWALAKANNDQDLANKIYLDRIEKIFKNSSGNSSRSGSVSKESIRKLEPIIEFIKESFPELKMYYGAQEFYIRTNSSIFKYDFVIPHLGFMIEYHGTAWHPRKGDIDWKSPFGLKYNEVFNKDLKKQALAEAAGYTYLIIWSDEQIDYESIKRVINEKHQAQTQRSI